MFLIQPLLVRDSDRIQTCNLLIRSQMLYSVELRSLIVLISGCKGMFISQNREIIEPLF